MEQGGGRWNLVSQAPSETAYSPARATGIGTFLQGTSSQPGRKVTTTSTYSAVSSGTELRTVWPIPVCLQAADFKVTWAQGHFVENSR